MEICIHANSKKQKNNIVREVMGNFSGSQNILKLCILIKNFCLW